MPVLARAAVAAALAALGACYDPTLPDCAVPCTSGDECGPGQVCGERGLCAAPEVADSCARAAVTLRVQIERRGRVEVVELSESCDADDGGATCTFDLVRPRSVELRAIETDEDFERWSGGGCSGNALTCRADLGEGTTEITARFKD